MSEPPDFPLRPLEAVVYRRGRILARCLLRPGEYLIGNGRKHDISIADDSVSPDHAQLHVLADGSIAVEPLTADGIRLNGEPISRLTTIPPGATIHLGEVSLHLERGGIPAAAAAALPAPFLRPLRYERGEVVVEGSTSTIYQARDTALGREVALRILHPEAQRDPAIVVRFVREAQVTAQLGHVGILPIYDFGLNDQAQLFFTTRFVAGEPLAAILERLASDPGEVENYDLSALIAVWQRVADVLAAAHTRGVIHQSLSPEAIEVARFGEVFVTQWTYATVIAHPADQPPVEVPDSPTQAPLTSSTSPEQAAGRFTELDERTDVFALGALLYQLLTLRAPLSGAMPDELLEAALTARIPPPREAAFSHWPKGRFPDALAALAMKALSYDPADRFQSVLEFQGEVAAWQSGLAGEHGSIGGLWKQFTGFLHRATPPAPAE